MVKWVIFMKPRIGVPVAYAFVAKYKHSGKQNGLEITPFLRPLPHRPL